MNIVYTVTLVDEIEPEIEPSNNPADVSQTLILDARETKFARSGSKRGIMYRWVCPSMLQEYCDDFYGSNILAISSDTFKNSGLVEENLYTFTLETFSLNIGSNPTDSE